MNWRAVIAVATIVASILLLTSAPLPLTWDEGESIDRAESLLNGERWTALHNAEGHPSGYAWTIAIGRFLSQTVAPQFFCEKMQWRFGIILLVAIACGVAVERVRREVSLLAAMATLIAMGTMPRLFAHSHIAACDAPLAATWLIAACTFQPASRRWSSHAAFAVALALTLSMKFTGWLAPLPLFLITLWSSRKNIITYCCACCVAVMLFVLIHPTLWGDPLGGLGEFFVRNVARDGFNIPAFYFGKLYDIHHPLPITNTLVWTVITMPVPLLILTVIGSGAAMVRRNTFLLTMLLCAATPLIARAMPGTPVHDAERLFLPALPFLAILAGVGADAVWNWASCLPRYQAVLRGAAIVLSAVTLLTLTRTMFLFAPQWLSFYSGAIGGLRGAVQCGFEPTYWWDSLDAEVAAWLEANTSPGDVVAFGATSAKMLRLKQVCGELPQKIICVDARYYQSEHNPPAKWLVLQHRHSALTPEQQELITCAESVAFVKHVDGVPLLTVLFTLATYREN